MTIRPRSGAAPPARMCMSVDLPAPLWPTTPTHSPAAISRLTPSRARTAPKDFSTPSRLTRAAPALAMGDLSLAYRARDCGLLHVGLDRRDRVGLRVFVASDAALGDFRQFGLEITLREGEVGHQQIVRNVFPAVEHLLRDPEREG